MSKKLRITVTIEDEDGKTIAANARAYKGENPEADIASLLSDHNALQPALVAQSNRELDKFVSYAKDLGTEMPFGDMEMGVLAAGRKDMQNGLAEILNSMKFDRPVCPECKDGMDNLGRSKKNS